MDDIRDQAPEPSIPPVASNSLPPPAATPQPEQEQRTQDPQEAMATPRPKREEAPPIDSGLARVLEIPLTIHVELGRKRMKIRELMAVGAGSVLPLETQAGASLSIYANETLIAEGEAVVVGERYGVRVTDIVSPAERVRRLGGE